VASALLGAGEFHDDGAQFFGVGEGRDGRLFPLRLCALAQA